MSTQSTPKINYLKSLAAIRERCQQVFNLTIDQDQLEFWTVDQTTLPAIVDFCSYLISRDYGTDYESIPPHGRWRHFLANAEDRISPLLKEWSSEPNLDPLEIGRRLVDLFVVAVLMDAGAGDEWKFIEPTTCSTSSNANESVDQGIGRSEGLAVGTLHAFKRGIFSFDPQQRPHQVDPIGLKSITPTKVAEFMQSKDGNRMVGLDGRSNLLQRLGHLLSSGSKYFPVHDPQNNTNDNSRPGNLIDYILNHPDVRPLPRPVMRGEIIVPIDVLWEIIIDEKHGLGSIWPKEGRESIHGEFIGDVWTCDALNRVTKDGGHVPFHKLSQWLTYSLIEVLEKTLNWKITGTKKMTGLPEYRNGGLLIDFEYIKPKPLSFMKSLKLDESKIETFNLIDTLPPLPASHPAIIEWRAITVIALDRIKDSINLKLDLTSDGSALSLPQVLEAATWKGGREIARIKRAKNEDTSAGPPIKVISDGTVF
ncbi:hypothetical protein Pst134EA_009486 [Puccinia striiformis f. sp. tritici]|uniref:hypothetical protein n=1 Tax=Puccinia striiformis f. sp. tritici TaxID=168172 RepID=UPI002007476E|nr:hypothetical protein Pst134EA_009486 [Puccinia striiformis f. sp. tritici]KAH9468962.1 hypothetical protein Pst134EA_009486 [Puccinia striiformis f. sp. tritici]